MRGPRNYAPLAALGGMPALIIEYAETADDAFDGSPMVPGFTDDAIFWACVARLPGGRTRWRRIHLNLAGPTT